MYRVQITTSTGTPRGYVNTELSEALFDTVITTGVDAPEYNYYDSTSTDSSFTNTVCRMNGVYDAESAVYITTVPPVSTALYTELYGDDFA